MNIHFFPSRYTFEVRAYSLFLPGCRHICRRDYLQPQCCPGHWGPDCMGKWPACFFDICFSMSHCTGNQEEGKRMLASFSRKFLFHPYVENLFSPVSFYIDICFSLFWDLSLRQFLYKEKGAIERIFIFIKDFTSHRNGEGNGNPLQCSCLENPRDGGAWWAAVYGVAQSRTRLKRLDHHIPWILQ